MKENTLIKKIFITITIAVFTTMALYGAKNYIKLSDIRKKRKIALISFTMPKDMLNLKYDKVKYLNNEIYIDYIANSFISNFNNANEYMNIDAVGNIISAQLFSTYPLGHQMHDKYAVASQTVAVNDVDEKMIEALSGKVDSYMFINANPSFWSQNVVIDFEIYDLNKELIWEGSFEGASKYIIADTSITPKTGYQIVIKEIMEYQKRHQSELYIILDEAIANSVANTLKKYPTAFKRKTGYEMIRTFSLTNENYAKKAGIPEWKDKD